MQFSSGGGGFPGGFPSMPGFGGPSPERDLLDRLQDLIDLHDSGALSDAEFEAQKAQLLLDS